MIAYIQYIEHTLAPIQNLAPFKTRETILQLKALKLTVVGKTVEQKEEEEDNNPGSGEGGSREKKREMLNPASVHSS